MTDKYPELVRKLKEIFQIDKPELDFGVYRVLNARRAEIEDFLENRFKARVEAALAGRGAAEREALEAELHQAEESARALGADPETLPKVKELRGRLDALAAEAGDAESQVYAHLLAFFSRYYESGDFISQRRFKDGMYMIPYSGEEVKLHWANADQYYTKTGEDFTNYDFPLDGGLRVHFHLVAADTAKDNCKDADAVRLFKLWNPADAPERGEEEDEAEWRERYPADFIEEKDGELVIHFQFLKFPKSQTRKPLLDEADARISEAIGTRAELREKWLGLLAAAGKGTVLQKHLGIYTDKNKNDYFIHKNLGEFLRRELDFYVKNEMMNLDEVEGADFDRMLAPRLRTIRAFRAAAGDLVAFMAQLEDFQKKLWLKKKFVVQCDWCITMDQVPEKLRAEVLANEAQQAEWKRLGIAVDPRTTSLTAVDARMVDTKFFSETFKAKLLSNIPDLDAQCNGIIIHSDNFQALRLMQERHKGRIKLVYSDPPYNTGSDDFLYKDSYQHSSWLAMMAQVGKELRDTLTPDGLALTSINDIEFPYLRNLFRGLFGDENFLANFIWNNEGNIDNQSKVKVNHEYILAFCSNEAKYPHATVIAPDIDKGSKLFNSQIENSITKNGPKNPPSEVILPKGFPASFEEGTIPAREDEWPYLKDEVIVSDYKLQKPVRAYSGWSCRTLLDAFIENGMNDIPDAKGLKTRFKMTHTGAIYCYKTRAAPSHVLSVIRGVGTVKKTSGMLASMGFSFKYPKPVGLLRYLCQLINDKSATCMDVFAGSGSTGHAVIELNRLDRGTRTYTLVEMGEHFDAILKPRLIKIVYSPTWKDGKPESTDKGMSHCFKYLTLESYEDTLNNLELARPAGADAALAGLADRDEYLLKYMLDVESRGSLLGTEAFQHPFDCELKVAVDSSGAWEKRKIDLVETFNWLLGLRVESESRHIERGVVLVEGTLPNGDRALVAWRDCGKVDAEALKRLLTTQGYVTEGDGQPSKECAAIYVNGDHSLRAVCSGAAGDTKVQNIERVFLEKMWEEE